MRIMSLFHLVEVRMKWARFALLFVSIVAVAHGSSKENPRLEAWLRSCQNETGASEDDFQMIKSRKIPTSKEGVCMVECLFTKLHIIENGQFNQRGFVITFSPIARGNLKKLAALKEVAALCQAEVSAVQTGEQCSATRTVLDCFGKNMDKLAIAKKP
ncbi:uncharacterized protein LOC109546308 [Dendroctonus ponderosae]|uniref:Uncharacterized protein n=1 Tax=Dendroctonus ponderosae TaxID=77166 RepID=A0AAR5QHT0_DENPD|nr:uncharacterized protein LOC109546308 [Dendroctonus ponderosae]KAH1001692.1 hypothetical protein HUJ04_005672 [Dendroctonus ponderosae]KAH1004664.1 hypothetical protein HUJ05_005448 [Dendroctonus ponderosae]